MTLWLEKYRPQTISDYVGNKEICKEVLEWCKDVKNKKTGTPPFLVLYGKPGVGKTTLAHIILKEFGYDTIEINASDNRTKTTIQETIGRVAKYSLLSLSQKKGLEKIKNGIILDEIDGTSAAGVIKEIIEKTTLPSNKSDKELAKLKKQKYISYKFPVICTCNNIKEKKLADLLKLALVIKLNRPKQPHLKKIAKIIIKEEKIKISNDELDSIISGKTDFRELINSLSLYNLNQSISTDFALGNDTIRRELEDYTPQGRLAHFISNKIDIRKIGLIIESDAKVFFLDLYANFPYILQKKQYWATKNKNKFIGELMKNFTYGDMLTHMIYTEQIYCPTVYYTYCSIIENIYKIREFNYNTKEHMLTYHNKFNAMCQEVSKCYDLRNKAHSLYNISDISSIHYMKDLISKSSLEVDKLNLKTNNLIEK